MNKLFTYDVLKSPHLHQIIRLRALHSDDTASVQGDEADHCSTQC